MGTQLGLLFLVMSLITALYMGVQAYRGRVPLVSVRNVFMAGLILFQMSSASIAYFTDNFGELSLSEPTQTGFIYALLVTLFTIIFISVYQLGWFTFGLARRVTSRFPTPGTGTMIALSVGFLAGAFLFRLVLVHIPVFGPLSTIIAAGLAATAAGFGAWAWARQPFNPATLVPFVLVTVAAAGLTLYQNFGRREVLSVMVACLWGAYHGHFKVVSIRKAAIPMIAIIAAAVTLVAAYTSVRGGSGEKVSFQETVRRLGQADISAGFLALLGGQDAAANSIWLLESRPPYDTLHSLRYGLTAIVPRVIYEDKPLSLGMTMVPETGVSWKGTEFSFGPGLIGHIANDNPWIALPLYAVILAAWIRILDDITRRFPHNPFVIVPIGVALGEILAVPRGELGLFVFRAITAMIVTYVSALVMARILLMLGMRYQDANASELALEPAVDEPDGEAPSADWPEEYR